MLANKRLWEKEPWHVFTSSRHSCWWIEIQKLRLYFILCLNTFQSLIKCCILSTSERCQLKMSWLLFLFLFLLLLLFLVFFLFLFWFILTHSQYLLGIFYCRRKICLHYNCFPGLFLFNFDYLSALNHKQILYRNGNYNWVCWIQVNILQTHISKCLPKMKKNWLFKATNNIFQMHTQKTHENSL